MNQKQTVNPYASKQSAIEWLEKNGYGVIDESTDYHRITIYGTHNMVANGKVMDVIKTLGQISFINFEDRIIEVFTAVNNVMKEVKV